MKKATHQTDRDTITDFRQIINIGPSIAGDFSRIGIRKPGQLAGQDPLKLYKKICKNDDQFHDPCVLDCFMSAIEFMNGGRPGKWWDFTPLRKQEYAADVDHLRAKYQRR